MLITWNKNICTLHGPRRRESSLPVCNCINIGPWDISEASMHLCDDFKSHRDHGSGLAAPRLASCGYKGCYFWDNS